MKHYLKYILIILAIAVFTYAIYWLMAMAAFSGAFDKHVSRQETVDNFTKNESSIMAFCDYFSLKKPANHEISFSLDGNRGSISIGMRGWSVDERFPIHHFEFKVSAVEPEDQFLKE